VLVYFGYPQAHEDDAERAVRAGLALIAAVGALYGLLALGFHVTHAVSRTVNFAQGSTMMLGAVLCFTFRVTLGWPLALAVVLALRIGEPRVGYGRVVRRVGRTRGTRGSAGAAKALVMPRDSGRKEEDTSFALVHGLYWLVVNPSLGRSRDVLIKIKSNGRKVSVQWFAGVSQSLCSLS
jgi:hypothetical protein